MKLFHETKIDLKATKTPLKICVISDLHFSRWLKPQKLQAILHKMHEKNPDYIFIPGDLVDNNEEISDPSAEKRLLDFLAELGKIAPTMITAGNHDAYRNPYKNSGIIENPEFIAKVNQLDRVFYLNDAVYEDDRIYVFGYNQKPKYYSPANKPAHLARAIKESPALMAEDLQRLKSVPLFYVTHKAVSRDPVHDLPQDKLKFALIHSPVHLDAPQVRPFLAEFDYFISGHMHDGVVLPVIFEIWRSDRGLIAPGKRFFPKNARTTKKTLKNRKIIAGAVTDFSKGIARPLNALFPIYFTTLNFMNETEPKIHRKYQR